jgi:hypothetical protein
MRIRTLILAMLVALSPLALCLPGCGAGVLPAIATAVTIADHALQVIDDIERHVSSTLLQLPSATSTPIVDAIAKARGAAEQVRERGKAAQQGDYERALDGLEQALTDLYAATRPLGVVQREPGTPEPLLGSQANGTLGVPSPAEVVRGCPGAEGCGPSSAPAQGAQ